MAYNRIFTKSKYEKANNVSKEMMEDFLLNLRSQKKSSGTIYQYESDLKFAMIIILENFKNKSFAEMTKKDFRKLLIIYQDMDLSAARINRLKSSMSSCLEYLSEEEEYEDDIPINFMGKLKGLSKESVRDIVFISQEEIDLIQKELLEKEDYLGNLVLMFLNDSCARKAEIVQVKLDSITKSKGLTNKVVGKRRKIFSLMYHERTKEAFDLYLPVRPNTDSDLLFIKRNGKPCTPENIYEIVMQFRSILYENEIPKAINVHSFRHSGLENLSQGTHYLCKNGKKFTTEELRILANHESLDTTMGYLKNHDEDVLNNAFDLEKE